MNFKQLLTLGIGVFAGASLTATAINISLATDNTDTITSEETKQIDKPSTNNETITTNKISTTPEGDNQIDKPSTNNETITTNKISTTPEGDNQLDKPSTNNETITTNKISTTPEGDNQLDKPSTNSEATNTNQNSTKDNTQQNNIKPSNSVITEARAKEIMLSRVPNGKFITFHFDKSENEYDGEIIKNNVEYDIEVNALTGDVVSYDEEPIYVAPTNSSSNNNSSITEARAKEIMLSRVPGGTFRSFHFDREDNTYDGELIKGNNEYDIEVSAKTGNVVSFDQEIMDKYDDYDDDDYDDDDYDDDDYDD